MVPTLSFYVFVRIALGWLFSMRSWFWPNDLPHLVT